MSLQDQQPPVALPTENEGRYLHLKAINVQFTCTRLYPKVKIEIGHGSTFRYESDTFKEEKLLQWDCDVYMRSDTKAVLSIHSLKGIGSQKLIDEVDVDFSSEEFGLSMTILYKGSESLIKLMIGEQKSDLDVAHLLVPGTVSALGSKVATLRRLDRVFWICELVVKLGIGASELNPHAKAGTSMGASILTEVIKKFRDIPSFHTELVLLMDNVAELLPIVELIIDRVTDNEVQIVLKMFLDFVIDLAGNLKEYASKPRTKFILSNWYKPKGDEIRQIKGRLENLVLKLNLGMQSNILGVVSAIRNQQISEVDNNTLKCLRPPINTAFDPDQRCLPDTRKTVLRNIKQWIFSGNSAQRLYWVHGVAGCGKSSVAASVASSLEDALSGSFFCKRDIPERRSPTRLIQSLAYFLAKSRSSFRKKLLEQLTKDPDVVDKPLSTQFKDLLSDPLSTAPEALEPGPGVIIVVDALDECDEDETVASYLIAMARSAPWLRLIVTSRPIPGIERHIKQYGPLVESCDLFRMTTNEDILHFTQSQFMSNDDLPDAHPSQIDALVRRAAGHFIWISTVLKHISIEPFGKVELLQQIIVSDPDASTSEEKLDAIYKWVLEAASCGSTGRGRAVKWIVGLVFVISRKMPLPSESLYAFLPSSLNARQNEVKTLIGHLKSVLYEDAQTGAVRACHPSFLDFIGSENRSGRFWTASTELDLNMARRCLEIMLSGLKFNICNLETSYLPNDDVVGLQERVSQRIPDALQYSCMNWMRYLSSVQTIEEELQKALQRFLCSEVSLFWLEVLSLMARLWEAKSILKEAPAVLKRLAVDDQLQNLTSHLSLFLDAFFVPIDCSTPHIYISAMLWVPIESLIGKLLALKFNSRDCLLRGADKHWLGDVIITDTKPWMCSIAYSPDGMYIVSGFDYGRICIWWLQTGTLIREFLLHGDVDCVAGDKNRFDCEACCKRSVDCVAYSPNGQQLVAGSNDGTLRIWDVHNGDPIGKTLCGHEDGVLRVAYSPDGLRIVSGSCDKTIRIWDAETGDPVGEPLRGHKRSVLCVLYSSDGSHVVSASFDNTIRIWDTRNGNAIGEILHRFDRDIKCGAFSSDGRHFVAGCDEGTLCIWDIQGTGPIGKIPRGHEAKVTCVAYSPGGQYIVSGSQDGKIRIWDAQSSDLIGELCLEESESDSWAENVAFSPDGRHIIYTDHDGGVSGRTIHIRNIRSNIPHFPCGHGSIVKCVAYSPDGQNIVSGSDDKTIRIWSARTGDASGDPLRGHEDSVTCVAYSPDGRYIVSGSDDETIRIWDANSGEPIGDPLRGHYYSVSCVAYSPDGRYIVSGSNNRTIRIWDANSGDPIGDSLRGHSYSVTCVAYSPDGRYIVSGSDDATILIWDANSGEPIGDPLCGHYYSVNCVAYSPDGRYFVSGSDDEIIRIWDANSGEPIGDPLRGHEDYVSCVAYSPDGRYIVSGSEDETIRIWDARTGDAIGEPLRGHNGIVNCIAYSPDGQHIVSGSDDKTVRIWDTLDCISTAKLSTDKRLPCGFSEDGEYISSDYVNRETPVPLLAVPPCIADDGWIRTPEGELILWVPYKYENRICDRSVRRIPHNASEPVRIDWQNLCHGTAWTNVMIRK